MGVPTLGCHCAVCESGDSHDKRTRPSVLLSYCGRNVVIDTTPDFRYQAMRVRLDRLDAVLYTHGHADHILGLDDIRPYNLKQKSTVPIYASEETLKTLRQQFAYIFDETPTENRSPASNCTRSTDHSSYMVRRLSRCPRCTARIPYLAFESATWPT